MHNTIRNIPKIFKAFASEKRIAILELLLKNKKGLAFSQMSQKLKINIPTLERHALLLREVGLLESKRYKNKMVYKIISSKVDFVDKFITLAKVYNL
ncbi:MAG: winged helix-turn-helix domain-containing protein [Candidatus Omnitrophica bacterium]|nr:winged helix-turn-helix domain-containing protein [Candidatus Omnitrophota bacterium]